MNSIKFMVVHLIVQIIVYLLIIKLPYVGKNIIYLLLLSSLVNIAYPYDNNNEFVDFLKWPMLQLRKISTWICSKI